VRKGKRRPYALALRLGVYAACRTFLVHSSAFYGDGGYLFRTTSSDALQGVVAAMLACTESRITLELSGCPPDSDNPKETTQR
jgi:hypothetical protein